MRAHELFRRHHHAIECDGLIILFDRAFFGGGGWFPRYRSQRAQLAALVASAVPSVHGQWSQVSLCEFQHAHCDTFIGTPATLGICVLCV